MRPFEITRQLDAASADAIANSQTPGGAGNLTLTASPVVLDAQRKVLITTTDDETGITFTITGTDESGNTISEVVTGVDNSTVSSVLDYKTVSQIAVSGAAADALTVGTSGVGASPPATLDRYLTPFQVSLGLAITGTVSVTVQFTLDPNVDTELGPFVWHDHTDLAAVAADDYGTLVLPVTAIRLLTNSGTGAAVMQVIQAGA